MLGRTLLKSVNLSSTTSREQEVFEHEFTSARSGTIKPMVTTQGESRADRGPGVVTQ